MSQRPYTLRQKKVMLRGEFLIEGRIDVWALVRDAVENGRHLTDAGETVYPVLHFDPNYTIRIYPSGAFVLWGAEDEKSADFFLTWFYYNVVVKYLRSDSGGSNSTDSVGATSTGR